MVRYRHVWYKTTNKLIIHKGENKCISWYSKESITTSWSLMEMTLIQFLKSIFLVFQCPTTKRSEKRNNNLLSKGKWKNLYWKYIIVELRYILYIGRKILYKTNAIFLRYNWMGKMNDRPILWRKMGHT